MLYVFKMQQFDWQRWEKTLDFFFSRFRCENLASVCVNSWFCIKAAFDMTCVFVFCVNYVFVSAVRGMSICFMHVRVGVPVCLFFFRIALLDSPPSSFSPCASFFEVAASKTGFKASSLATITCCSLCEENINRTLPPLLWFNGYVIEWLELENL